MIAGGRRSAAGAVAAASVSILLLLAAAMYAGRGGGEHGSVVVTEEESSGMGGRSARGRHHGKGGSLPSISRAWKDLHLAQEEVTTWKKLSEERRSHMPFVPPPGERVPEDEWRVAWAELGCPHKKPDYEIRALGCNRKGGCGAPRPAPPSGTVEEVLLSPSLPAPAISCHSQGPRDSRQRYHPHARCINRWACMNRFTRG
jgi:hypothetical protein